MAVQKVQPWVVVRRGIELIKIKSYISMYYIFNDNRCCTYVGKLFSTILLWYSPFTPLEE